MSVYLGIDTSCYTTSVAIMDCNGNLLADKRKILSVKPGGRGLSQSEMVFQHTRNLPELIEAAVTGLGNPLVLSGIGASAYPRPLPNSYMPAFLVGSGYAKSLAALFNVPLFQISHQEGHIFSGIWSAGGPQENQFLAIHVSGGTTEIVKVVKGQDDVTISLLGESLDLHAGQFIDRVGVAIGLPFPTGRHLETLALKSSETSIAIPICVKNVNVSFSGPATHALRLLEKGEAPENVAAGVQLCIGKTISKMIKNAVIVTGVKEILLVGGVLSNEVIREYLSKILLSEGLNLYFPQKEFSPDNSVGCAYYALKAAQ